MGYELLYRESEKGGQIDNPRIVHVSLSDVLNVDTSINSALFEKAGLLGELYVVAIVIEEFDTNVIDNFLYGHGIEAEAFETLMLKVFQSATELERSADPQ